jgi:hypothetical protein
MDVIYLACVLELANVVTTRSYPPFSLSWTERYRCIAAHGKARALVAWISERYELHSPDGEILNAFEGLFSPLLGQQAAVLLRYKAENPSPKNPSNGAPKVSVSALQTSIVNCLVNNTKAHTAFLNSYCDTQMSEGFRTFAWTGPTFQVRNGNIQASLKPRMLFFSHPLCIHSCPFSSHRRKRVNIL